jgi:type IV pilus assembly protein PilC
MKFKYQAKTKEGEMQVGYVEAGNRDAAANILAGHELYILSLEPAEKKSFLEGLTSYFGRVKRKDMVIFTRQLATLLEARLPLNTALKTLEAQTKQPVLKEAVRRISDDINAGISFSQAMERQGAVFPRFYVEMVRAAEITGNLNEISGFLADYAEKEGELASKATSAMVYPGVVVGLFIVVAAILIFYVFPQLQPIFEGSNVQLPIYTQILLSTGNFLVKWWAAVLIVLACIGAVIFNYAHTPEGKALIDDSKIKLPILRNVFLPVTLARFSNAAALLVHGGIPIAQALEIIGHMVGNVLYRDIMHEVSEGVRRGELLSQSVEKYPEYFPPLVSQMIAVGETTGKIEQIFSRLAAFYGREADAVMNNLVDLIQPIMMIVIGALVGLLFASILIPLYSLTSSFGG